MLNKLLVVAAIVAFAGIAGTASAGQTVAGVVGAPRYYVYAADTAAKSKQQDKSAKKKTDKAKEARSESSNSADQNAEEDEGKDQPWESELFVNNQGVVIPGESAPILTK